MKSIHRSMDRGAVVHSAMGPSAIGAVLLALCLSLGCGGPAQGTAPAQPEPAATPAAADSGDGDQAPAADQAAEAAQAPETAAPALSATALGPQIGGGQVRFNFKPGHQAKKIYLAGSFNGWKPSNDDYLLTDEDGDGIWSITIPLASGSYQYKFVADGKWTKDPRSPKAAPDGFGGQNGAFDVP